jgi:hypothetical protein
MQLVYILYIVDSIRLPNSNIRTSECHYSCYNKDDKTKNNRLFKLQ